MSGARHQRPAAQRKVVGTSSDKMRASILEHFKKDLLE